MPAGTKSKGEKQVKKQRLVCIDNIKVYRYFLILQYKTGLRAAWRLFFTFMHLHSPFIPSLITPR
jgi:hypothetical protein